MKYFVDYAVKHVVPANSNVMVQVCVGVCNFVVLGHNYFGKDLSLTRGSHPIWNT